MNRQTFVLVATSILVLCFAVQTVFAVGCGEPVPSGKRCTNWQCSRNFSNYCVRGFDANASCTTDDDCYHELYCDTKNHTCQKAKKTNEAAIGYAAAAVAVLFFGSNFVPAKKFQTGNGVFFQFIMCVGIFCVGVPIQLVRENSVFYPEAMLTGVLWCCGNIMCVPIIQCIGIGLSLSIWGTTNMLVGWASGHFGIMGVKKESVKIEWLSYEGVAAAFFAIVVFMFIKPVQARSSKDEDEDYGEAQPLFPLNDNHDSLAKTIGPKRARVLGILGAILAGCFFGVSFDPSQHLMDNYSQMSLEGDVKYSPDGLDYVFSAFCGIMMTSTFLTCIYLVAVPHLPTLFPPINHGEIILPALASGVMWAIADASWFIANTNLGLVVSFPIIAVGPGLVAALWGLLYFGEIKGQQNLILLAVAFILIIASSTSTAVAKQGV